MENNYETHSSGLVRRLGLFSAIMLVVSAMIGSGVFKKVAPMAADVHAPYWVLSAWAIAGIISLFGALTNAEIAGMIAEPGGQYAYFRTMYGRMFSFLYGWTSFAVIQSATIASVAYVFAESVNTLYVLPTLSNEWVEIAVFGLHPFDNFGVKVVTIGLIAILTTFNYRGLEYGRAIGNIFASTVVVCIVCIILMGLTLSEGSNANVMTASQTYSTLGGIGLFSAMFTAMMSAFWAYEGWNNLGFMGGEVEKPHRNIPLGLMIGVGFVMLVYLSINYTYLYVLPIDKLIEVNDSKNSIAAIEVVKSFMGQGGVLFITVMILMATFGSANNTVMSAARIYFAMAQDKLFFKKAGHCHEQYKTPSNALLMQATWSSVLVLSGTFDQLTDMLIFASFMFYGAGALGVFILRRKMPNEPRPYKAFGYPVIPAFFILFCIVLVGVSLVERPAECGAGLVLILTGLPFYYWFKKSEEKVV